jgi:hypothetical protein
MAIKNMDEMLIDEPDYEETREAVQSSIGKTIVGAEIDSEANGGRGALVLRLADGTVIHVYDSVVTQPGSQFLTTDDDLTWLCGGKLRSIEVEVGPDETDEDGYTHEVDFVRVVTDIGDATLVAHNDHPPYYGGITMCARLVS